MTGGSRPEESVRTCSLVFMPLSSPSRGPCRSEPYHHRRSGSQVDPERVVVGSREGAAVHCKAVSSARPTGLVAGKLPVRVVYGERVAIREPVRVHDQVRAPPRVSGSERGCLCNHGPEPCLQEPRSEVQRADRTSGAANPRASHAIARPRVPRGATDAGRPDHAAPRCTSTWCRVGGRVRSAGTRATRSARLVV